MKKLILVALLTSVSSEAGVVRFAAKSAFKVTVFTAKVAFKAGKIAGKLAY